MQPKLLPIAVVVTVACALATAGCTKKTDDHYEGKVKSNEPSVTPPGATPNASNPQVVLKTSLGNIHVELLADKAPITVKNFLRYVDDKFYDNTIFHRVISNFMIQGGGMTTDLQKKPTRAAIKNEADNGVSNTRGTLAMARTKHPDSATAQFFINVKDSAHLNHRGPGRLFGYCVFGRVIKGMDVVEKIRYTPTRREGMLTHLPIKTVVILQARRLKQGPAAK